MKAINLNFWGTSRYWWIVLILGLLMVVCGFAYFFWPSIGYAVSSQIFGWMCVLAGIVQLCVSSYKGRPRGWGWWLAGGIVDLFIGFMLVRSVVLSEAVFPYFLAMIFIFWGIRTVFCSVGTRMRKYWWMYLINGILLIVIGFLFVESGWAGDMRMISFLSAIAFCYWGFYMCMISCDMRPSVREAMKEEADNEK